MSFDIVSYLMGSKAGGGGGGGGGSPTTESVHVHYETGADASGFMAFMERTMPLIGDTGSIYIVPDTKPDERYYWRVYVESNGQYAFGTRNVSTNRPVMINTDTNTFSGYVAALTSDFTVYAVYFT